MTHCDIIRNNLNNSDREITKDKCDSARAHRRHLAANEKHENKRKIYCTNVCLRIIEILITLMYKFSAVTLMPLHVADSAALLSTTFYHSPLVTGLSTHLTPGCTWLSSPRGWRPAGDLFYVPQVPLTRKATFTQAIDLGCSATTLTPAEASRLSWSPGPSTDFPSSGPPALAHVSSLHGDWFPDPMGLLLGGFCRPFYPVSDQFATPRCPFPLCHIP